MSTPHSTAETTSSEKDKGIINSCKTTSPVHHPETSKLLLTTQLHYTTFNTDHLSQSITARWSGDVMKRPGQKILMPYPTTTCGPRCCFPINVTDHFPCLPNFLLLNAKSKSWSRTDEICPRDRHVKFKNNTSGCKRLWDTALKFLCPGLFIMSPDHLVLPRVGAKTMHKISRSLDRRIFNLEVSHRICLFSYISKYRNYI